MTNSPKDNATITNLNNTTFLAFARLMGYPSLLGGLESRYTFSRTYNTAAKARY